MYHSKFLETHAPLKNPCDTNSIEYRFLTDLLAGDIDISKYMNEKTFSGRKAHVYTPYERYEGFKEIKEFASDFRKRLGAVGKIEIKPVAQTIANGRICLEAEFWIDSGEEETKNIPMSWFFDIGLDNKIEGVRLYYFFKWVEGTPAYFRPYFKPSANKPADPHLMTGIIRYYYEQLHNFVPKDALANILSMFDDDIMFGALRPIEYHPPRIGIEAMRLKYSHTTSIIPGDVYIRFETITDDGVNCATEWVSIVRQHALKDGIVSMSGMASYQRGADGKIISVRILDNFGYEADIDLSTVLPEDNFVD